MELQEIPKDKEKKQDDDKGASEPMLKAKTEVLEEAEADPYAKLEAQPEDVYSEAYTYATPPKIKEEKQTEGNGRWYRRGCLILTLLCLLLLLVVIILCVRLQTGSTLCPETTTVVPERQETGSHSCSLQQCQDLYPSTQLKRLGCSQCASGWRTYGRSCFYLSTLRLSWEESQKNCTASGGSLAVISSQGMQNFLTKEGNLKYWIGLRQRGDTWTWVNNSMMHQSYWAKDKSSTGDCAILDGTGPQSKNWMKTSCDSYTYYICQLQL